MARSLSFFSRRISVRVIGIAALTLLATGMAANLAALTLENLVTSESSLAGGQLVSPAALPQSDLAVQVRRQMVLALFVMLLLVPILALTLRATVLAPLQRLRRQVRALAHGDLESAVTVESDDEIGRLAAAVEQVRVNLHESFEDLFRQNERLSQLDQMKDEMLGQASHELRTPLTSIHGFVQVLAGGKAGPLTELQEEVLTMVGRNVDRLRTLVCDLLDAERVDKTPLNSTPVAVEDLLQEVIDDQQVSAREKGLALNLAVPDHTRVMGDKERLREVFTNLISNAIKYTDYGRVSVRSLHTHDRIVLEFQDTGIGIASHLQPHVFDRFFRVDDQRVQGEEGTGLGLTIVKRLVTRLNGMISLSSEPGRGTTFRVTLPRAADEQTAGATAARTSILVATPDPLVQTVYGATLTHDRFDLSYASSPSGVLLRTRRERPDVVVLALGNARPDELVRRVARGADMARVHFVIIGGRPLRDDDDDTTDPVELAVRSASRLPVEAGPRDVLAVIEARLGLSAAPATPASTKGAA